jgi:hypothetical protein
MAAPLFLQLKGYCAGAIQSYVEKLDFYENIEIYGMYLEQKTIEIKQQNKSRIAISIMSVASHTK